jgi:hypothetical protein
MPYILQDEKADHSCLMFVDKKLETRENLTEPVDSQHMYRIIFLARVVSRRCAVWTRNPFSSQLMVDAQRPEQTSCPCSLLLTVLLNTRPSVPACRQYDRRPSAQRRRSLADVQGIEAFKMLKKERKGENKVRI